MCVCVHSNQIKYASNDKISYFRYWCLVLFKSSGNVERQPDKTPKENPWKWVKTGKMEGNANISSETAILRSECYPQKNSPLLHQGAGEELSHWCCERANEASWPNLTNKGKLLLKIVFLLATLTHLLQRDKILPLISRVVNSPSNLWKYWGISASIWKEDLILSFHFGKIILYCEDLSFPQFIFCHVRLYKI